MTARAGITTAGIATAAAQERHPYHECSFSGAGWFWGLLAALILASGAQARPSTSFDEIGRLYLQNFAPEDYGAHRQNFALVQHETGLLYVGNGAGVLEYDGVSWRLIPISNNSLGRSLAIDSEGRIFVGSMRELGYLAADTPGRLRYVSLLEHIPVEDRDFADVWKIHALAEGVYFQTRHALFRWKDGQMKVWRSKERFSKCHVMRGTLYVSKWGQGLFYMAQDDTLRPVPGGEAFAEVSVAALLAHGTDASLIVTRRRGVLRCRDSAPALSSCVDFSPDLAEQLRELQPYHATLLQDGRIALGTASGGVMLLDPGGSLLRSLNQGSGLLGDKVLYTFVDRQGGLWLGLDSGLSRVEVTTRLSYFDRLTGLGPGIRNVARHGGRLYATIGRGLQMLEPAAEGSAARFVSLPGSTEYCFPLLTTPRGLLVGCQNGIYDVEQLRQIQELPEIAFTLYLSKQQPTRVYAGLTSGLSRLKLHDGAWRDAGFVDGIREQVRSIVEDTQGRLWLGTPVNGVLRVEAPFSEEPVISRFGVAEGLPTGWNHVYMLAGRVVALSPGEQGLFRMESRDGSITFVPDTTFDPFLPRGSGSITDLAEDEQGRVWILAGTDSGVAIPQGDDRYRWEPTRLRRGATDISTGPYLEPGGPMWVYPGLDRLLRFDPADSPEPRGDYEALIRRVSTPGEALHFDGQIGQPPAVQVWPHRDQARRFEYAVPFFDAPERTRYRTRLDGFDDSWSTWSTETHKEYTNLWEGRYVFRVEARNVYGFVSPEATFAFRILPPWYRTWWAYGLYGLVLASVVLLLVRWLRGKLRRERAVSARLREVDKLKDELIARTSHELRTPLFGLVGLAESLVDGVAGELPQAARDNLTMIAASGRRLGRLVNDIVDHSRLTHGSLRLRRGPVDLHSLVETVLRLQGPLIADKSLQLENAIPPGLPAADADEARLEQILHNLIGNAVKFTARGHVVVSAQLREEELSVSVEDSGIGIAEGDLERIFSTFEQADSGIKRAYGGTGMGLALARRLVELHGGNIEIDSTVDEGTRITFTLPVANEPARPSELSGRPVTRPLVAETKPLPEPFREPPPGPSSAPAPKPRQPARGIPGARILVVDDEPVNRIVLELYLASEGYEVELAETGAEALRVLDQQAFDLVVLDVMMPQMSGYEACRTLRRQDPLEELPVIFLTAKNQVSDLVEGLDAGGNDYLAKPVDKDELLARVRTHLELLSIHRQLVRVVKELEARNAAPSCIQSSEASDAMDPADQG